MTRKRNRSVRDGAVLLVVAGLLGGACGPKLPASPARIEFDRYAASAEAGTLPDRVEAGAAVVLQPGDVIEMTRWVITGFWAAPRRGPVAEDVRIPIRNVTSGSSLHDYERRFLYEVLALNRSEVLSTMTAKQARPVREFVADNEADVWNAVMDSVRLRCTSRCELCVEQGIVDTGSLCKTENNPTACFFDVEEPTPVCPAGEMPLIPRSNDTPSIHQAAMDGLLGGGQGGKNEQQYFYEHADEYLEHQWESLAVTVAGLDLVLGASEEGRWSLQEWQDADVCKFSRGNTRLNGRVSAIVLRRDLVGEGRPRRYLVDPRRRESEISHAIHPPAERALGVEGRELIVSNTNFDHRYIWPIPRISADDLENLTMEHVDAVTWTPESGSSSADFVGPRACRHEP